MTLRIRRLLAKFTVTKFYIFILTAHLLPSEYFFYVIENMDSPFLTKQDLDHSRETKMPKFFLEEYHKWHFEKIIQNYILEQNRYIYRPTSTDDLRIVVIGKTGVGKSATANSILGTDCFQEDVTSHSTTVISNCFTRNIDGRSITVMDTPGLEDTQRSQEAVLRDLSKVMITFSEGVHAFVYVFNLASPRFTKEDERAFVALEAKFGGNMKKHRLLIYTHAESTLTDEMNLDMFCDKQKTSNDILRKFFGELNGNIVAVNNKSQLPVERKRNQNVILGMIDKIRNDNQNTVYSNEMFHKAERMRKILIRSVHEEGYNPLLIEAVNLVIAKNPDSAQNMEYLRSEVKSHLEKELDKHRKTISEIKLDGTENERHGLQENLDSGTRKRKWGDNQMQDHKRHYAELNMQRTKEVLARNDMDHQINVIGQRHTEFFQNFRGLVTSWWDKIGLSG